jgi:hypothetical protein
LLHGEIPISQVRSAESFNAMRIPTFLANPDKVFARRDNSIHFKRLQDTKKCDGNLPKRLGSVVSRFMQSFGTLRSIVAQELGARVHSG